MSFPHGASLKRLWPWWWRSITAWLHERAYQRLNPEPKHRLLHWDGNTLSETSPPGAAAETVVLLARHLGLVRSLQLPNAARRHLLNVVRHEIERQTPFAAEQVYFDAVSSAAPAGMQNNVIVSLVVVPKTTLDAAVAAANDVMARIVCADLGHGESRLGANLLPPSRRYRTPIRWRNWNIALGVTCCIALTGIAIAAMHARQRGMERLEEEARPLLAQTATIRQRQAALTRARSLSVPTNQSPPTTMLEALSELSATLPLSSHLAHIEFKGGVITARGQTDDLSGLLEALRANRLWKTPELTGSRTLPDGKSQAFSLRLRVRQGAATRPAP